MTEIISIDSAKLFIKKSAPDTEWLLAHIESEQGWCRFPPYLTSLINNLKIESYPLLYLNENSIVAMMFKGYMTSEEIKELDLRLTAASPNERGQFFLEFTDDLINAIDQIEIPKTPAEQEAANNRFKALSADEQVASIRISQHFFCSFFASFYQTLSIMVHGEKLTSLVSQAIAGNDIAFVKAVQIDRRILTEIPYFSERYVRAQYDSDSNFYDSLSYRLKVPPYKGKIRYKSLWLVFAILDQSGLLNSLTHPEILKICDDAGVGGYENRIQSVKHLTNRLKEYREFQKRSFIATI